jgi:LPS sulfotransferase NodH
VSKVIYIIGRQRSGTTVLRELFVKYGALNADEVFHGDLSRPHRFYAYVAEKVAQDPRFVIPTSHAQLFRSFVEDLKAKAKEAPVVIDMKYFALNLIPTEGDLARKSPFIIRYLEEKRPPVFHVIRRNKLRVFVSELIAKNTGKWSARNQNDLPKEKNRVTLDPVKTVLALRALESDDRVAREMLANVPGKRELIYENMFLPNGHFAPHVINACEKVLGVSSVDPLPFNIRMNPEPLHGLIENFEAIEAVLTDTEFAWMIKPGQ